MKRGGDQQAWSRDRVQRAGDVLRKEGLARPERAATLQGEQESRFEAIAVLDRYGAHDGVRAAIKAQRNGFCPAVGNQFSPGLALRLWQAGRAGGEENGGQVIGGNQRY